MNSADERVWELLQTLDLENLDITTFQGVAAPIFAQKENKEALEALALIAFARMARQGEFNGWLNAGGGGDSGYLAGSPNGDWQTGRADYQSIDVGFGRNSKSTNDENFNHDYAVMCPFAALMDGALTEMQLYITTASAGGNIRVGIYNTDDNNNPTSLIGYADFATDTVGNVIVTSGSFSNPITLERGTVYWYSVVRTAAGAGTPAVRCMNSLYNTAMQLSDGLPTAQVSMVDYSAAGALANPASTSTSRPGTTYDPPKVAIRWI